MPDTFYMLVRQGKVQRLTAKRADGSPIKVWPVAETHADAVRLATWFNEPEVRAAEIGSVPGETLENHIALAINEGCQTICCVNGWGDDGKPKWKTLPLLESESD